MSVFLERLYLWNMLNCAKQVHIQKYKTHAYRTLKTASIQRNILCFNIHISIHTYLKVQPFIYWFSYTTGTLQLQNQFLWEHWLHDSEQQWHWLAPLSICPSSASTLVWWSFCYYTLHLPFRAVQVSAKTTATRGGRGPTGRVLWRCRGVSLCILCSSQKGSEESKSLRLVVFADSARSEWYMLSEVVPAFDLYEQHIKGFRPEWCISSIYPAWDTPFWSGTLHMDLSYQWCSSGQLTDQAAGSPAIDRLVGLVVRRPPRERKIPGSNPACAGIFSGLSHTSDVTLCTPVATLPGALRYRVITGTGGPGVSILWLCEVERLICNFYLSLAARKIVWADPYLRYTRLLLGR